MRIKNLLLYHNHSSRMESRLNGVRLQGYTLCDWHRDEKESGWWSDERMMKAPERAMFTAAFAFLPLVVWLILLAGHRG
ncbi:hypothetical protein G9A89_007689 [Geosiphon pyriformis]|nr:hypothetical protein G9A89_007689 [Geosiphon pyriformis]